MKKLLSILGAISLISTSTTSLVACNKTQYSEDELKKEKEKHKIDTKDQTIKDNLEWMASQEKPFNTVDNKWYYVVWRGNKKNDWKLIKFKNDTNNEKKIDNYDKYSLIFKPPNFRYYTLLIKKGIINTDHTWYADDGSYFKSVYRWNLDTQEPDLIIDNNGNVKVNGE